MFRDPISRPRRVSASPSLRHGLKQRVSMTTNLRKSHVDEIHEPTLRSATYIVTPLASLGSPTSTIPPHTSHIRDARGSFTGDHGVENLRSMRQAVCEDRALQTPPEISYAARRSLTIPMLTSTDTKERPYECATCKKRFSRRFELCTLTHQAHF